MLVYDILAVNGSAILGRQYDELIIKSTTRGDNCYGTCEMTSAHVFAKCCITIHKIISEIQHINNTNNNLSCDRQNYQKKFFGTAKRAKIKMGEYV